MLFITDSVQLIQRGFGDFKMAGKVICSIKYADDLVLLLQDVMNRLIEVGRCSGM